MHVVLSDHHIPFHDPVVEQLSLQFIRDYKPSHIHLLGDVIDFYSLSRFDKDPNRINSLQKDIDDETYYFRKLRHVAPDAEIYYSGGNHEYRFWRYLCSQAKELVNLRSLELPTLLRLNEFNIKWFDWRTPYRIGSLLYTHGDIVRNHSAATARANFEKYGCSVICGHTHRLGAFYHRSYNGQHGAWENGCCCSLDPDYTVKPDWQNGWSVVWYYGDVFQVEQICVLDGCYVYRGEVVTPDSSPPVLLAP